MKFRLLIVWMFFLGGTVNLNAQSKPELPYAINSSGGYGTVNGLIFDFNIGEMLLVQTFDGVPDFLFSQGFLQPFFITAKPVTDVTIENNVITPNNDGKNDFFVIQGLNRYPNHKVKIFDRAGRIIFSATNYQNNFNGRFNGKVLNEDAYYYVIDLGKEFGLLRGSISIILDNK